MTILLTQMFFSAVIETVDKMTPALTPSVSLSDVTASFSSHGQIHKWPRYHNALQVQRVRETQKPDTAQSNNYVNESLSAEV